MKRKNKLLATTLIIASAIILVLSLNAPLHKETILTMFVVGEATGFDLTLGKLNFGKITPGQSATRKITITNTHDIPIATTITSSGAISPYIIVSENNIILQPNQSKELTFSAYPSKDLEHKEYPGEITITTHKA